MVAGRDGPGGEPDHDPSHRFMPCVPNRLVRIRKNVRLFTQEYSLSRRQWGRAIGDSTDSITPWRRRWMGEVRTRVRTRTLLFLLSFSASVI